MSESTAAVFAGVAADLDDVPAEARSIYFSEKLGVRLSKSSAEKAIGRYRMAPRYKQKRGPKGQSDLQRIPAIRSWVLVDGARLGLSSAVVEIPGYGAARPDLVRALSSTAGVVRITELAHRRNILLKVVFASERDKRAVRAAIEELAPSMIWDDVLEEDESPSIATWRELARREARQEGLLADE